MTTTWTPGPIRFRRITKPGWYEYDFIADDSGGPGTYAVARFYGENHEADARLWAQAPAMAEFIRTVREWFGTGRSIHADSLLFDDHGIQTEADRLLSAIEEG